MSDHAADERFKPIRPLDPAASPVPPKIPALPPHLRATNLVQVPEIPANGDTLQAQEELHQGAFNAPVEVVKARAEQTVAAPVEMARAKAEEAAVAPEDAVEADADEAKAAPAEALKAEIAISEAAPEDYQKSQLAKAEASPEKYAEAEEAKEGAAEPGLGPKGKPFIRQKQAGTSFNPKPTPEQAAHMDPRTDKDLVDMEENFTAGKNNLNDASILKYNEGPGVIFKAEAEKNNSGALQMTGVKEEDSPNASGREVASSLVDKMLGLGMVPNTQFATHGGQFGSSQELVSGISPTKLKATDPEAYKKLQNDPAYQSQRNDLQVFDWLTGNLDRHGENSLVQRDGDGGFQKLHAIDNGCTFPPAAAGIDMPMIGSHNKGLPEKYNEAMVEKVRNMDEGELRTKLKGLVSETEIDKMIERRKMLLDDVELKGKDAFVEDWGAETKKMVEAEAAQDAAAAEAKRREADEERRLDELADRPPPAGGFRLGFGFGYGPPPVASAAPRPGVPPVMDDDDDLLLDRKDR